MEWIGEFFGELIVRLLGFFAGKMFDEKSRTKRVIFFLIFYAPNITKSNSFSSNG